MSDLRRQLAAHQAAETTLQATAAELAADKQQLVCANQQLQQAVMDGAREAASGLDSLRQQHVRQLQALQQEQQRRVEELQAASAATAAAHKEVRAHACLTMRSEASILPRTPAPHLRTAAACRL